VVWPTRKLVCMILFSKPAAPCRAGAVPGCPCSASKLDFGAQGFAVELEGLLATAIEEEIRFNDSIVCCRAHNVLSVLVSR